MDNPTQRPRILIVDESRMVRATLIKLIRDHYSFREETDGESGWQALVLDPSIQLVICSSSLPMLDGGRMFFVVLEILRGGRRISPEKEGLVHFAGFALMMAGVLVVTYFDIARLVT